METKLTLRLKKKVIDQAKKYADDHETSLSKLIENYLEAVTSASVEEDNISPLVMSLSGIIQVPDNTDPKEEYRKHISEKYL